MNGIIVIDKPQGMTSHDVVSFLRGKTGVKRIGHTGTLDPMATGVLAVFIGKATRVIEYAGKTDDREAKLYRCTMKMGMETDTQDIWGQTLSQSENLPNVDNIERVLKSFEGQGMQKPPLYSAVKVGGRKLYEYARKGTAPDESLIRDRMIYIKHINVKHIDKAESEVCFDILCSKGVYIRTLCADAGRKLGCGAVMSGLRRLKSDGFSIESAYSIEALREGEMPPLLSMDTALGWIQRIEVDEDGARALSQGQALGIRNSVIEDGIIRIYSADSLIGIGCVSEQSLLKPVKILI